MTEDARNVIYRASGFNEKRGSVDWLHINAMSYVGPNQWYDEGDERFHPDNVLLSIRRPNVIAIVDRIGAVVWRMGPDYRQSQDRYRNTDQALDIQGTLGSLRMDSAAGRTGRAPGRTTESQ